MLAAAQLRRKGCHLLTLKDGATRVSRQEAYAMLIGQPDRGSWPRVVTAIPGGGVSQASLYIFLEAQVRTDLLCQRGNPGRGL